MLLIRSAKVVFPNTELNGKTIDILIQDGKVKRIGTKLRNTENAEEISLKNLHIAPGFVDMQAYIGEPGFEQKETVESACKAAASGGITQFCVMPNLQPVTDSKSQVEFLIQKSKGLAAKILPVGAATHRLEGKDLADVYDMHEAGAIAFSDGYKPLPNAGILERILLYTSAFGGLVMEHAEDKSLSKNGVMHEGEYSTELGLPPMPAIAEEIAVARDLAVLDYAKGRLHLMDISLKQSLEHIRKAKKKGLDITASCNAYNLIMTHSAIFAYETELKVNPPLRDQTNITALLKALADGTIDCITSQHNPQDEESKKLEFDKAEFGMIGFETLFAISNTMLNDTVGIDKVIELLSINPRKILGLNIPELKEGATAEFVLFDPEHRWEFLEKDIVSKSKNTPFVGTVFTGKVYRTITS